MVPFTDNLLRACRKLAIKLEASMRFQGRVFLSEIGTPEHDYGHLIQLFGELRLMGMAFLCQHACNDGLVNFIYTTNSRTHILDSADVPIHERCSRVCMLSLLPPHQENLAECPACSKLTVDQAFKDFTGMLILIEVSITRQSYLIGDMSNKQSHNQAWWRWTIDNFLEHGFEVPQLLFFWLLTQLLHAALCKLGMAA